MNQPGIYKQTSGDKLSNFLFRFTGLKDLGEPLSLLGIIGSDTLYKMYPDRYNFYMQVMESITNRNPKIVKEVIRAENASRARREIFNKKIKAIYNYFSMAESTADRRNSGAEVMKRLQSQLGRNILTQDIVIQGYNKKFQDQLRDLSEAELYDPKTDLEQAEYNTELNKLAVQEAKKELDQANKELQNAKESLESDKNNPANKAYVAQTTEAVKKATEKLKKTQEQLAKANEKTAALQPTPKQQSGGELSISDLKKYLFPKQFKKVQEDCAPTDPNAKSNVDDIIKRNEQYSLASLFHNIDNQGTTLDSIREKEIVKNKYMQHDFYSPNNEKIDWGDRGLFICITYIIRTIGLFLTEWAIFTGYVTTFTGAFSFYFGMYMCIFILLLFIVNSYRKDMTFRLLFFYINTDSEDGKGYLRVVLHFFALLTLIPMPYMIKEYSGFSAPSVLSFDEKSKILGTINSFSLIVWLLTSLIAFIV